jgi:hypothetical protein
MNRSVIRMRAYAVRLLRLRRIEFSVHTDDHQHREKARTASFRDGNETVPGLALRTTEGAGRASGKQLSV